MEIITYIMIAFAILGAIDRIFGSRLGLGIEFEKGIMMFGTITLAMAGMLVLSPLFAHLLSGVSGSFPKFLDFSIIPASLLANDMGGAHLSSALCSDEGIGAFNGLIVSSMMGATVSFTIPNALSATKKEHHANVLFGILCGIATIPFGCLVAGVMAGVPFLALVIDLVPLIVLAALICFGLLKFKDITVKIFTGLGWIIKLIITVGFVIGAVQFLTGKTFVPHTDSFENIVGVLMNIMCIMTGAFPLLYILKKALSRPLSKLGNRVGLNRDSVFGFISTLGTTVTTFDAVDKMDKKGVVLNSAFAVSAAFVFVDHFAFTMSYNAGFVLPMIAGKLISGVCAVALAAIIYKK